MGSRMGSSRYISTGPSQGCCTSRPLYATKCQLSSSGPLLHDPALVHKQEGKSLWLIEIQHLPDAAPGDRREHQSHAGAKLPLEKSCSLFTQPQSLEKTFMALHHNQGINWLPTTAVHLALIITAGPSCWYMPVSHQVPSLSLSDSKSSARRPACFPAQHLHSMLLALGTSPSPQPASGLPNLPKGKLGETTTHLSNRCTTEPGVI